MKNDLRKMIIIPTMGIILLLVVFISIYTFFSLSRFTDEIAQDGTHMASRGILSYIDSFQRHTTTAANALANNPRFIELVQEGEHGELLDFLNTRKEYTDVDFYAVFNHEGRVLVRTHAPERYGDMPPAPAFELAQEGIHSLSFHSSSTTPMSFTKSVPLYDNGRFIGAVMPSMLLSDPRFLESMSESFGAQLTLFYDNRAVASTFPEFYYGMRFLATDEISETVLRDGGFYTGSIVISGVNYSVYYFPLVNSNGEAVGMVSVAFPREHLDAMDGIMLRGIMSIGVIAASVAISILMAIISRVSRPIIEANERVKLMFDSSPVAMFLYDRFDHVIDCNEKAQDMFGYPDKKTALEQVRITMPPKQANGEDTSEIVDTLMKEAFETGLSSSEIVLQKIDGTPLPAEITYVRMKHNGADAVAEYVNDLSEVKAAEQKERDEKRFSQIILDNAPLVVTIRNSKNEILHASRQVVEMFGVADPQQYINRLSELSPELQPCGTSSIDKNDAFIEEVFQSNFVNFEWMYQTIHGEPLPMNVTLMKFKHQGEDILATYAFDLRNLRAAEEKEQEAQKLNQLLLDSAPLAINIRNIHNELLQVNSQFLEAFGIADKEEYMNNRLKYSPEYQPCGTETMKKNEENYAEIISKGKARFEWMYRTIDGEPMPMEMVVVKAEHKGEEIFLSYAFDLRPIKEAMQLIAEKERQAEMAAQESVAKSRFLAQISHEIRTPMNAVLGIAEIQLQNESLSKDLKESLTHIRNSSYLLLAIINNLLDMSKAEAGKMEIIEKPYETISVIVDTVQINMFYMGSKRIEFNIRADENLPVILIGDELRIKQILNNLLSNAFKYTNEGSVELSLDVIRDELAPPDEVALVIRIKDTGRGMSKSQQYRLFGEEFLRFNENDSVEGSGLGMIITYQLVKMMGGKIEVVSELGKGTEVTMRIPQKTVGDNIIGSEFSEKLRNFEFSQMVKHQVADFVREPMPYGRVLVVDDVELNLYVAKGHFAPYDLEVDTAMSGFEAIDKINRGEIYDIVFMDHMMPEMDGVETVKKLRDDGYVGTIVALTANALVGNVDIFIQHGFDDFISKPIDIRDLNQVLETFVRGRYPEEAAKYKRGVRLVKEEDSSVDFSTNITKGMWKAFRSDANKAIVTLQKAVADRDLLLLATTVHGMKPSLAYIGEDELFSDAAKLEEAGKTGDMKYVYDNANQFVEALKILLEKLQSIYSENDKKTDATGDVEHLAKKLKEIEEACDEYDVKVAITIIDTLLEESWNDGVSEKLQKIRDTLYLDSNFDVALEILKDFDS